MTDDPATPVCAIPDDVIDAVALQVIRLGRLRDRTNAQIAAATQGEIEPAAFAILFQLIHHGPMRSGALAEALYSDASTISRQVAALVKKGLLERRADPSDGRVSVLAITEMGRTVATEIRARRNDSLRKIFGDWPEDELETFARLFARFVDGYEISRQTMLAELSTKASLFPKIETAESNS
ncbi:MarR family winged helix-turn-helix transcriptional regulator [Nocardia inohanensis]|uniref:MarR family winged helix-turn-helix transcriptional regulator n=1 Tax=Nocardia inohanensis TaxID=209246 RepID=UPI00082E4DB8|nr:MarR family winged helix-turn-helix transcriptional regulator [Nocardia inohanensis]